MFTLAFPSLFPSPLLICSWHFQEWVEIEIDQRCTVNCSCCTPHSYKGSQGLLPNFSVCPLPKQLAKVGTTSVLFHSKPHSHSSSAQHSPTTVSTTVPSPRPVLSGGTWAIFLRLRCLPWCSFDPLEKGMTLSPQKMRVKASLRLSLPKTPSYYLPQPYFKKSSNWRIIYYLPFPAKYPTGTLPYCHMGHSAAATSSSHFWKLMKYSGMNLLQKAKYFHTKNTDARNERRHKQM